MTTSYRLLSTVYCLLITGYWLLPTTVYAAPDPWEGLGIERLKDSPPAPEFSLKALDGKEVALNALRGKVVFLNFWATWCPPCKAEMPSIEMVHKRFKDKGLVVLAVDFQEDKKSVQRFIKKGGYTFTVLLDPDGAVTGFYKAIYIPITYIIDRNGRIVGRAMGMRDWAGNEAFMLMEGLLRQ